MLFYCNFLIMSRISHITTFWFSIFFFSLCQWMLTGYDITKRETDNVFRLIFIISSGLFHVWSGQILEMGVFGTILGFFGFGFGTLIGLVGGYFLFIYNQPTDVKVIGFFSFFFSHISESYYAFDCMFSFFIDFIEFLFACLVFDQYLLGYMPAYSM